MINLKRNLIK